jgi:hypothetical protein
MKSRRFFSLLFLLFSMTFLVSSGIASHTPTHGPMGNMKMDAAAKTAFETGKALADHTYYYSGGSIIEPDSVIAIKKGYTLRDSKVWAKVDDMEDRVVRTWLQAWKAHGHSAGDMSGGVLLDSDGKQAGIWYSHFPRGSILVPIPGVLDVFPPQPIFEQKSSN